MRMRSSRVLEHTILPSALVTTTPPQLQQGQGRGWGGVGGRQGDRSGGGGQTGGSVSGRCVNCRSSPASTDAANPHRRGTSSQDHTQQAEASPALELLVLPQPGALLGRGRQEGGGVELHRGGSGAKLALVLGLQRDRQTADSSSSASCMGLAGWWVGGRQQWVDTSGFCCCRWALCAHSQASALLQAAACTQAAPRQLTCAAEMESFTSCWSTWRQRTRALGSSSLRSACGSTGAAQWEAGGNA
jgi:hypothetical protein